MSFRILFMGTPEFAVPILKSIHNSNNHILEVFTQPPKKKDRGQKVQVSPIHELANNLKIKVRHPLSLDSENEIDHIKKLKPDIAIVVAYGKILPKSLLNLDKILFINLHASLLPKWRGAAPIQRSIMNLDNETGISIMKIISKLDAGPVLIQNKIKIDKYTDYQELSEKMSNLGAKLILEALKLIKNGQGKFIDQIETDATYAKKIQKFEAKINWNESANKIVAKINALNPNPGCWFELNGVRLKVLKAKEISINGKPGEIIKKNFTIACLNNAIQILELKKEGKQKMKTEDFLRGFNLKIGHQLK